MDLALMRTLRVIYEEGTLTQASEKLGVSPQAVSMKLQKLERQVGRKLIIRNQGPVRLTSDGEAMLIFARRATNLADDVRRHFAAAPLSGSIRIGVTEAFTLRTFTFVLAALRDSFPDLEVFAMIAPTFRLEAAFREERLDLMLGVQRVGGGAGRPLLVDPLRWAGDLAPYEDPKRVIRLAAFPEPTISRTLIIEALTEAGRPYVLNFESDSLASLRAAVVSGLAISAFCREIDADLERLASDTDHLPPLGALELFVREQSRSNAVAKAISGYVGTLCEKLRIEDEALGP